MTRKKVVWGARVAGAAVLALASVSCGDVARQGTGSSFLTIATLEGSSGADPGTFGTPVLSDVVTIVEGPDGESFSTIFNDLGRATFTLNLKDPGTPAAPTSPSSVNAITIDRYHVRYLRTDGRNTEGVDVPFAFDGAVTTTVSGSGTAVFTLVRHQAKQEAPLGALGQNGIIVTTIAEVTFFGHDQAGRAASVTGKIEVNFGNFADQ